MERGTLRFVKWKKTARGRFVAKCMGMKRLEVSKEEGYRFRCMSCHRDERTWVWPQDGTSTTMQRAPLEVRLHVLEHHPDRRWSKTWPTRRRKRHECPNCGFNLASYRIPERDTTEDRDEDE